MWLFGATISLVEQRTSTSQHLMLGLCKSEQASVYCFEWLRGWSFVHATRSSVLTTVGLCCTLHAKAVKREGDPHHTLGHLNAVQATPSTRARAERLQCGEWRSGPRKGQTIRRSAYSE